MPLSDMRSDRCRQAFLVAPVSSFTIRGAGPCFIGKPSGGFEPLAISAAEYSLVLPGKWIRPAASELGGCTLSMLYAHAGMD